MSKTDLRNEKENEKVKVMTFSKLVKGGAVKAVELLEEHDVIILTMSSGLPLKLTKARIS